jgi:hypothetical protein
VKPYLRDAESVSAAHLYLDDDQLCAIWTDARPMTRATLAKLGGQLWQGDVSRDGRGRRIQDAWVKGVLPGQVPLALRLIGAKRKRRVSEATLAHLAKINPHTARMHSPALESIEPAKGVSE